LTAFPITESATANPTETAGFLTALYGDIDTGWLTLFSASRTSAGSHTDWFPVDDIDTMVERAMARAETCCVWFGVATRRQHLPSGRGGAADCDKIPGLWLDIDVAGPRHADSTDLPPTLDDARTLLDRFEHPPSLVIDTGGGLQPWWLFPEAHTLTDDGLLDRWHATWARLAGELGWRIDNVFDPARIMRLPGTLNRKPGVPPAAVEIVDAANLSYDVADLAEILDDPTPPRAQTPRIPYEGGDRPGDEFMAAHNGNDVFLAAGWVQSHVDRAGNTYWIRPRADGATHHAAVVYADGHIANYSETSGLEVRRSYDAWGLHVTLNHNGDFTAAAKAWRKDHPKPRDDSAWVGDPTDATTPDGTTGDVGALPDGHRSTDTGNANRLIAAHGEHLRFVPKWVQWLVWDDTRWALDDANVRTSELAKDVARRIFELVPNITSPKLRTSVFNWAKRSENVNGIAATIKAAQSVPGVPVGHEALDPDPMVLNVANGMIDLRTGRLVAHNPEKLCSKLAPVRYDPDATCPGFDAFLKRILPDEDVRTYVQRFVGYCLTGDVSEHVFPVWHGDGANGKSTLLELLRHILGDYCTVLPRELILAQKHETHDTKYVDLFRARLGIRSETKYGGDIDEERIKSLTGADRVKARRMRENYWEFDPTAKLVLATNHKPEIKGTDHAIWRRIHLVPFSVTIPEDERDSHLGGRLAATELPGILSWAVRGCLEWRRIGLAPPGTVRAATNRYRIESDLAARFVTEVGISFNRDGWERSSVLLAAHRGWCEENSCEHDQEWPKVLTMFKARGAEKKTRQNVRGWQGVTLPVDGATNSEGWV
jgi:P4 family phage/plasmid primase-like protien